MASSYRAARWHERKEGKEAAIDRESTFECVSTIGIRSGKFVILSQHGETFEG